MQGIRSQDSAHHTALEGPCHTRHWLLCTQHLQGFSCLCDNKGWSQVDAKLELTLIQGGESEPPGVRGGAGYHCRWHRVMLKLTQAGLCCRWLIKQW